MADEKKPKKDDKKESAGNPVEEGFVIALVIFLLVVAGIRIYSYFQTGSTATGGSSISFIEKITGGANGWFANLLHTLNSIVSVYVTIATVFSLITFIVIIYVYWLIIRMHKEDDKKDVLETVHKEQVSDQSQKWQKVLAHANSQNVAEWRLSLLEADVILDEMLDTLGYHGESMGDKLKQVDKADFKTIDLAWEAHKIRNLIAHEGADFLISQHEAKRIIGLYEKVFKEFLYI